MLLADDDDYGELSDDADNPMDDGGIAGMRGSSYAMAMASEPVPVIPEGERPFGLNPAAMTSPPASAANATAVAIASRKLAAIGVPEVDEEVSGSLV